MRSSQLVIAVCPGTIKEAAKKIRKADPSRAKARSGLQIKRAWNGAAEAAPLQSCNNPSFSAACKSRAPMQDRPLVRRGSVAAAAAQSLSTTIPGVAQDIELGATMLAIIQQLLPHSKAAVQQALGAPVEGSPVVAAVAVKA